MMDELDQFIEEILADPVARISFEDAQMRTGIIDKLVALRRSQGLTQTDVAKASGVTQPSISEFERESSDPRISSLQRYARAVGSQLVLTLNTPKEGTE